MPRLPVQPKLIFDPGLSLPATGAGGRDWLSAHGVTIDANGVYTFQGVADGGANRGDRTGDLLSGDLAFKLDTSKAGWWPGGFLSARLEGRTGDSVLRRAGTTSPVDGHLFSRRFRENSGRIHGR